MKNLFIAITLIAALVSCGEQTSEGVSSKSPDKSIEISVKGSREGSLMPWKAEVLATGKGLKGNINFEFHAGEISDKTVSFVWDKDRNCTITFHQQDDTKRIFMFTPNSTEGMWADMSPK